MLFSRSFQIKAELSAGNDVVGFAGEQVYPLSAQEIFRFWQNVASKSKIEKICAKSNPKLKAKPV